MARKRWKWFAIYRGFSGSGYFDAGHGRDRGARVIVAEKPLPIIISTGVTDELTIEAARQVPVQAFLTKPFRKEQLRASIAIALTQWEHQLEAERKLQSLLESGSSAAMLNVPRISEEAARQFGLTRREYEVLCRIAEGSRMRRSAKRSGRRRGRWTSTWSTSLTSWR